MISDFVFLKHSTLCAAVFHSVLACICLCLYLFVEVAGKIRLCESFDGNSRLSQIGQSTNDFKIQSGPPPNYLSICKCGDLFFLCVVLGYLFYGEGVCSMIFCW